MGKTSNESKRKYNEKTYDRIQLVVKKGKKEELQAAANNTGLSLNAYIVGAAEERMERDRDNDK